MRKNPLEDLGVVSLKYGLIFTLKKTHPPPRLSRLFSTEIN